MVGNEVFLLCQRRSGLASLGSGGHILHSITGVRLAGALKCRSSSGMSTAAFRGLAPALAVHHTRSRTGGGVLIGLGLFLLFLEMVARSQTTRRVLRSSASRHVPSACRGPKPVLQREYYPSRGKTPKIASIRCEENMGMSFSPHGDWPCRAIFSARLRKKCIPGAVLALW